MACVTLKRPLEFDPIHSNECSPSHKRRRCMPVGLATSPKVLPTSPKVLQAQYDKLRFSPLKSPINRGEITRFMKENIDHLKQKGIIVEREKEANPKAPTFAPAAKQPSASPEEIVKFNFNQVVEMCWRRLRESDSAILAKYSEELRMRKCDQYDQFLQMLTEDLGNSAPAAYIS